MSGWNQGTLYLRHTDKDGNSYVAEHRCWDVDRFLSSQNAAAASVGGKSKIEVISETDYKKERKS